MEVFMKRAFHFVYTILALNFFIPVFVYIFDPHSALTQFVSVGALLGTPAYIHSEDSVLWRVLAIANVTTLGFCCVLLQVNIRKWYPALVPLAFLKSMAALGFLIAFMAEPFRGYLAAFALDSTTVLLMVFFARGAYKKAGQGLT